ncbi:hypothetical protein KA405_00600 [Patescibacteria group bacterium]|nr:hypothetical protein [Patescibacteria group bacterium]
MYPVPMSNASIMWLERVMLAISSILLSMRESFDRAIGLKISMVWNHFLEDETHVMRLYNDWISILIFGRQEWELIWKKQSLSCVH